MLTRNSQVGEFYIMSPPQVAPKIPDSGGNANNIHTCDLMIYDEESDKHVRITWREALAASCAGQLGDTARVVDGTGDRMAIDTWRSKAEQIAKFNEGTGTWLELVQADCMEIRIVVARPFIEHLMHNVILTVAGRDTGATLFGPADMQLSANTQVKTIEGHYTGHFKAVVTKPQNVMVMRDVACAGYVAGCNTRWFSRDYDVTDPAADQYSLDVAKDNIMSRLSFDDETNDRYQSMLAFPAHEQQFASGQLDTVMSVTHRLLPWEVSNSSTHDSFPGGDDMFKAYASKLDLGQVHYGEDTKSAENQDFISQVNLATFPQMQHSSERATFPFANLHLAILCRALQTTPPASWALTASTTHSPSRSWRSRRVRDTLDRTPFRETHVGVGVSRCRSRPRETP